MKKELLHLPIGTANFANLRNDKCLYVDKTDLLQKLIEEGRWYFLARPRRFGKSLTVSTLEAMFAGQSDLFRDLKAEPWVQKQSQNTAPVITLDLNGIRIYHSADELNTSLSKELLDIAHEYDINLDEDKYASDYLIQLLAKLSKINQVVLLIDEYDAPILDNLHDKNIVEYYIEILRDFYRIIKAKGKYLRFVFITGISTFTKALMGYAMNNLHNISLSANYGSIVGYTQDELEEYFSPYIYHCCKKINIKTTQELYTKI
ncbi:MAG: AAA family ATPase [Desulfovibrionaceae bacterium]|nr:AAA family ATPase [Desulfovibrionaceae bacterium]